MATEMTKVEQDIRLSIMNSILSCPHRDLDKISEIHKEMQAKDPLFYAHFACWYRKNGEIRDHKEVFAGMLCVDSFLDNREVGLAMVQDAPVFMKKKILGFIKGKKIKIKEKTGQKISKGKGKTVEAVKITEKTIGLFKNVPGSFKKEIESYLRSLEANPMEFDTLALNNRNDLKTLYASLKIKPSERANNILFHKKFPEDSKMNVIKEILGAETPAKKAELIVKNKVSYRMAVGLIDKMSPSILLALVNAMSPQEVITNIASLEEKGAMENPDTKALIDEKLKKAQSSKSVSALKSKTATGTGRVKNEETIKKLDAVADTQVKRKGSIDMPIAILVDRSGSMEKAIEVGKRVAAMVSGASSSDVYAIAFDTAPMEVVAKGKTLTDWEVAFKPVKAGGGTAIGCGLEYLLRKKKVVEQIIIITDEEENQAPWFHDIYNTYVQQMGVRPVVNIVSLRSRNTYVEFENRLKSIKCEYYRYEPDGKDYNSLPGLLPFLIRKSRTDVLYEIMDYPMFKRRKAYVEATKKMAQAVPSED